MRTLSLKVASGVFIAALAGFTMLPSSASAHGCGPHMGGGGASVWQPTSSGSFASASLFDPTFGQRFGAVEGFAGFNAAGDFYSHPDNDGCELNASGTTLSFPAEIDGEFRRDREVYVDPRKRFARSFDTVTNLGGAEVSEDVIYNGYLMQDSNGADSSDPGGSPRRTPGSASARTPTRMAAATRAGKR